MTVVAMLTRPVQTFDGATLLRMIDSHVVYIHRRDGRVLYIGCSSSGLRRPLSFRKFLATDTLEVRLCVSRAEAFRLENELILALKPRENVFGSGGRRCFLRAYDGRHRVRK